MEIPPAPATDTRDQHIADLRAALQRAIPLLGFAAGRKAAPDPRQAETLLAAADHMTQILTAPPPELGLLAGAAMLRRRHRGGGAGTDFRVRALRVGVMRDAGAGSV
ncbi:hypothetical protein [Streptomyces leeuwenhoekii]|uniref:Uncharacterized protein n=1 Tax=Streptomyces leeuwenhoekii TaxID=1437453 RepID=A0A0F7VMN7_STRLW|nr:hypothetical protein [Streptomyces leeuwenhoekii]KMS67934.1 hypothetical protein ACH49_27835 [Streptomyces leeuwenhoekii]CQR59338.1 hypothetical protein [Streptomyces leeuwenhoekii]